MIMPVLIIIMKINIIIIRIIKIVGKFGFLLHYINNKFYIILVWVCDIKVIKFAIMIKCSFNRISNCAKPKLSYIKFNLQKFTDEKNNNLTVSQCPFLSVCPEWKAKLGSFSLAVHFAMRFHNAKSHKCEFVSLEQIY